MMMGGWVEVFFAQQKPLPQFYYYYYFNNIILLLHRFVHLRARTRRERVPSVSLRSSLSSRCFFSIYLLLSPEG